jgi:membrane protein
MTEILSAENMGVKKLSKAELARSLILVAYLPISIFFDLQNFSFPEPSSYLLYVVSKLVQLFLLYLLLKSVQTAIQKRCIDGKFRLALILFAVLFVGLLLLWPGNWVEVDEYKIYQYALMLQVHPTRGLFIAVMYVVGLMFFFHPVMISGFQLALGAWIYAELIQQCRKMTGRRAIPVVLLLFSPVTLYFLYQPMRTFLFGALLLLFLQRYLLLWHQQEKSVLQKEVIKLSLLVAGLICIRTEIKFLLLVYPIMLAVLFARRKLAAVRQVVTALLIMILTLSGYTACERSCAGGDSPVALNYVMPIYTILQDPEFDREAHREELESIDRVYAIDEIMSQTNRAYTLAEPRDGYTKQEMNRFLTSSTKLILAYPRDFLRCRWNEFVISVGFDAEAGYIQTTENVMSEHVKDWDVGDLPQRVKPLNAELRNKVSKFLGGQFTVLGINMNFVFWALWLPIVITTELFLVAIWEKRIDFVLVLSVLLIELVGIILTAPVKYAMYYFANYLGGWYLLYLYCFYRNQTRNSRDIREKSVQ